MTSKYGVRSAVRPSVSVAISTFPRGSEANARTVLGFSVFPGGGFESGYRPNILVVLTVLPRAPVPRVARCEKAMPRSSAETRAVWRVPRKPRCVTLTFGKWPSAVLLCRWVWSRGGMLRKGLAGRVVSQVNMLPLVWPPAMVVWSAEMAMAVMGPDSTAGTSQPQEHSS